MRAEAGLVEVDDFGGILLALLLRNVVAVVADILEVATEVMDDFLPCMK